MSENKLGDAKSSNLPTKVLPTKVKRLTKRKKGKIIWHVLDL